jgi:hypothetical protein
MRCWWLEWARCSTTRASVSAGGALDARIRDSQPAYAFWLDQADRKRNDSGPPAADKQKPTAACQQAIGSVGQPSRAPVWPAATARIITSSALATSRRDGSPDKWPSYSSQLRLRSKPPLAIA